MNRFAAAPRFSIRPAALLLALAAAGSASGQNAEYKDIPAGFDFPADQDQLLKFRDTQNVPEMRRHAWAVWAGMTQPAPGGEAIWETWYSGDETFDPAAAPQSTRAIQRRFTIPRQFMDQSGPTPQAIGKSLISFTLFNKSTRQHIRGNKFNLGSNLTALNDQLTQSGAAIKDRRIKDFPREAMSLKTTWWAVRGDGMTPAPVWDFEPTRPNASGNDFDTWERVVAIDSTRQAIPVGETRDISMNGVAFPASKVVSLSSFYHFKLETADQVNAVNNLAPNAGASPVRFSLGRNAQVGDYVALVALHYTTKEIPDWVWSTFWWHDKPDEGGYAEGRLDSVKGVWRNYLMDTSYSMAIPREYDGAPNSVYNPWLEAPFENGMSSNCMTCHQRAVWPRRSFRPVTIGGLKPDDPYFSATMQLDFLWSIALESRP